MLTQAVGLGWARSPLWGSTGIVGSRAERAGEADGRLAVVELQQFCLGQDNGSAVPHPDWRRAIVAGISDMRKAHGDESSDCYTLFSWACFPVEQLKLYSSSVVGNVKCAWVYIPTRISHCQPPKLFSGFDFPLDSQTPGLDIGIYTNV